MIPIAPAIETYNLNFEYSHLAPAACSQEVPALNGTIHYPLFTIH
ncbi:hypothetical protein [Chamaesiphon sp. OTE_8_metabat_110]|nr:hypothetical protein [Chamaesiphon sp. OTE_8_metabat_110]